MSTAYIFANKKGQIIVAQEGDEVFVPWPDVPMAVADCMVNERKGTEPLEIVPALPNRGARKSSHRTLNEAELKALKAYLNVKIRTIPT